MDLMAIIQSRDVKRQLNTRVEIHPFLRSSLMSPPLPPDMLDQIFRELIAHSELDDLDDRLVARGLPAHAREQMKVFTPVSELWQPLVAPIKVNKSWRAAGL